ncbi:sigma-70 family RNA polymerase sigma factor [Sporosarcina luteola]|uniref:sigma factor-like helix-turn-helix DNA-binding protein n=1 Tax=Bacillales TaxID=1385 RepID=UPI00203AC8DC|nr:MULTISPECIES: sigma factor-like helix-turn-helix DNA-binding protein [Bacillales]MCM3638708.1 sigma-70 family RNA polymerase sigma factor [Sporosarcina luteola]
MKNPLLNRFFEDEKMMKLYDNYLKNPTDLNKVELEKYFFRHARKIQLLNYFSKVLNFEGQRFDKKTRQHSTRNQLNLDKPIDDGETILNLLPHPLGIQEEMENEYFSKTSVLEDLIEEETIAKIVSSLSEKQKEILTLIFLECMSEEDIARKIGVTKQAVNKSKRNTLKKIEQQYELKRGNPDAENR